MLAINGPMQGKYYWTSDITHKVNLYRKDPEFYAEFYTAKSSEFNKPCCDKCLYYWATHKERA